jgi:hypothetical protein
LVNDADRPARRAWEVLPLFEAALPQLIRRISLMLFWPSPLFSKCDLAVQRLKSKAWRELSCTAALMALRRP